MGEDSIPIGHRVLPNKPPVLVLCYNYLSHWSKESHRQPHPNQTWQVITNTIGYLSQPSGKILLLNVENGDIKLIFCWKLSIDGCLTFIVLETVVHAARGEK